MKTAAARIGLFLVFLTASMAGAQEPLGSEHGPDTRPFPHLSISVQVPEEKDKASGDMVRVLLGSGESEYPRGTKLVMSARLVGAAAYLSKAHQVSVNDKGHWQAWIDDLGRNVYKGTYEVRVTFDPTFQTREVLEALGQKFSDRIHSESTQVRLGTAEEEAAEKNDVDQFFARIFGRGKQRCEALFKEYENQLTTRDRRKWFDLVTDTNAALVDADHELGEFVRMRDNLRDYSTYELISQIFAIASGRLTSTLTMGIGMDAGQGTAEDKASAQDAIKTLRTKIAKLDETVGKIQIDPNWKMIKPLVPIQNPQPPPPSGPIDPVGVNTPPRGPEPTGGTLAPKSPFGIAEFGIGFAIMCGIAMLVVLLKRK